MKEDGESPAQPVKATPTVLKALDKFNRFRSKRSELLVNPLVSNHDLSSVKFFKDKDCDVEFVRQLNECTSPALFAPGQYLTKEGEEGLKMYFIRRGSVEVLRGLSEERVAELGDGDLVGEIALLGASKRVASVKALQFCDCWELERSAFQKVARNFPNERSLFEKLSRARLEQLHIREKPETPMSRRGSSHLISLMAPVSQAAKPLDAPTRMPSRGRPQPRDDRGCAAQPADSDASTGHSSDSTNTPTSGGGACSGAASSEPEELTATEPPSPEQSMSSKPSRPHGDPQGRRPKTHQVRRMSASLHQPRRMSAPSVLGPADVPTRMSSMGLPQSRDDSGCVAPPDDSVSAGGPLRQGLGPLVNHAADGRSPRDPSYDCGETMLRPVLPPVTYFADRQSHRDSSYSYIESVLAPVLPPRKLVAVADRQSPREPSYSCGETVLTPVLPPKRALAEKLKTFNGRKRHELSALFP